MNLIKNYILNFLNRAGSYVLLTTVLARLLSFFASWIALQLIPSKELGVVLYAFTIISFIIPLSGLGLHQSLIRYSALLKTTEEKNDLFVYVFKKGIPISILIVLLIILISWFIPFQFKETNNYLMFLSLIIIPSFLLEIIKNQFRLHHNNKAFAFVEIAYTIILVLSVFILSYFYQEKGYIIALIITPLLSVVLFIRKIHVNYKSKNKHKVVDFSFWKYGFFASLANVATQFLFAIDILLIGYLLKDAEMVTNYKYISLIPFSLLFLPRVFMATDFVTFTEKIKDQEYISEYIRSYMLLFTFISLIIFGFSWLLSTHLLTFFDEGLIQYIDTFLILIFGIIGILIFRGLFGNLLSSMGKAHINYYIVLLALVLNGIGNFYLIPKYGIKGAAITSALLMWFTGILSYIWFHILYKKFIS